MTNVIALSEFSVVEVNGADAGTFLQAQTMNDVGALAPGRWQFNGLLNPKGRVLFLFQLLRLGPERFWLLQPVPRAEQLARHLLQYRFRSKVSIECRAELAVAAREDGPLVEADWTLAGDENDLEVWQRPLRGGVLRMGPAAAVPDPAGTARWHADDLRAGIPYIGERVAGSFTPQMLRLERISAYSVRKGCYPGQEVVARTHYLGAAKRHAQLLRAESPVDPGSKLASAAGESLGEVVDAVTSGDETLLLAVLNQPLAEGEVLQSIAGCLRAEGPA